MSDKNTVTISLGEYNKLLKIQKEIEEGKILSIVRPSRIADVFTIRTFYTESEALSRIVDDNNELKEKFLGFKNKIESLLKYKDEATKYENELSKLKEMSWLQFIKWKRNNNN